MVPAQLLGRPASIVGPVPCFQRRYGGAQLKLTRPKVRLRVLQPHNPISARACDEEDIAVQRHRKDVSLRVVGMLADQVDAARRTEHAGGAWPVQATESLQCRSVPAELRLKPGSVGPIDTLERISHPVPSGATA
jgi:hypothetical protein